MWDNLRVRLISKPSKFRIAAIVLTFLSVNFNHATYAASTWQRRMDDASYYISQHQKTFGEQNILGALAEAKLSRSKPQIFLSLLAMGDLLCASKNYAGAEKYYLQAAALYPRDSEALNNLVEIYRKTGRKADEAKASANLRLRESSDSKLDFGPFMSDLQKHMKEVWIAKCKADPVANRSHASMALVRFMIAPDGKLLAYHVKTSSGLRYMDRIAEETIIASAPFRLPEGVTEELLIGFGFQQTYAQTEKALEADKQSTASLLKSMKNSLKSDDPTMVFYLCNHAKNCVRNKSFDEALELYRQAVNIVQTNKDAAKSAALAYGGLAECLLAAGKPEDSEQCYRDALPRIASSSPNSLADFYHGYGVLLYKLNRAEEGNAMFAKEKALR